MVRELACFNRAWNEALLNGKIKHKWGELILKNNSPLRYMVVLSSWDFPVFSCNFKMYHLSLLLTFYHTFTGVCLKQSYIFVSASSQDLFLKYYLSLIKNKKINLCVNSMKTITIRIEKGRKENIFEIQMLSLVHPNVYIVFKYAFRFSIYSNTLECELGWEYGNYLFCSFMLLLLFYYNNKHHLKWTNR